MPELAELVKTAEAEMLLIGMLNMIHLFYLRWSTLASFFLMLEKLQEQTEGKIILNILSQRGE